MGGRDLGHPGPRHSLRGVRARRPHRRTPGRELLPSGWRAPGDPRPLPDPDAIAVAPATFNTINKWAAGISDTLALGILCEAYGLGVPTAVLPAVNSSLAAHPAYAESLRRLRGMGVLVSPRTPHTPKSGEAAPFPWEDALELLAPVLSART